MFARSISSRLSRAVASTLPERGLAMVMGGGGPLSAAALAQARIVSAMWNSNVWSGASHPDNVVSWDTDTLITTTAGLNTALTTACSNPTLKTRLRISSTFTNTATTTINFNGTATNGNFIANGGCLLVVADTTPVTITSLVNINGIRGVKIKNLNFSYTITTAALTNDFVPSIDLTSDPSDTNGFVVQRNATRPLFPIVHFENVGWGAGISSADPLDWMIGMTVSSCEEIYFKNCTCTSGSKIGLKVNNVRRLKVQGCDFQQIIGDYIDNFNTDPTTSLGTFTATGTNGSDTLTAVGTPPANSTSISYYGGIVSGMAVTGTGIPASTIIGTVTGSASAPTSLTMVNATTGAAVNFTGTTGAFTVTLLDNLRARYNSDRSVYSWYTGNTFRNIYDNVNQKTKNRGVGTVVYSTNGTTTVTITSGSPAKAIAPAQTNMPAFTATANGTTTLSSITGYTGSAGVSAGLLVRGTGIQPGSRIVSFTGAATAPTSITLTKTASSGTNAYTAVPMSRTYINGPNLPVDSEVIGFEGTNTAPTTLYIASAATGTATGQSLTSILGDREYWNEHTDHIQHGTAGETLDNNALIENMAAYGERTTYYDDLGTFVRKSAGTQGVYFDDTTKKLNAVFYNCIIANDSVWGLDSWTGTMYAEKCTIVRVGQRPASASIAGGAPFDYELATRPLPSIYERQPTGGNTVVSVRNCIAGQVATTSGAGYEAAATHTESGNVVANPTASSANYGTIFNGTFTVDGEGRNAYTFTDDGVASQATFRSALYTQFTPKTGSAGIADPSTWTEMA